MQKTVLVTGGAGFIGSHVVNSLIDLNFRVIMLDDLSGGCVSNLNPKAEFCKGCITDVVLVEELFKNYKFNYIYHLAAYAAEGLSHFIRRFNYQNNLIGSINLINAAVNYKVECFVFTSSIAVYGNNDLPYHEGQHPKPEDPYGIAKYAVEMDLKNAKEMFGLNSIIFRPHNVYGSNQNLNDPYRNVIGIFMNQLLQNKSLSIFGDGSQTRAFTHINDVAPYIANSVNIEQAYNQIFNIGGDVFTAVKDLASEITEALNIKGDPIFLEARKEAVHAYANHEKFKSIFCPKSSTDLKKGLLEMGEWAKEQELKPFKGFEGIEIDKNLPKSWKNNR